MLKYRIKFALNYYAGALDLVEEKIVKPDQLPNEATLKKYKKKLGKYKHLCHDGINKFHDRGNYA